MKDIALAFGLPGGFEWILIVLIIVLLFGSRKIPELARSLGEAVKEFRKSSRELTETPPAPKQEEKKD